MRWFYCKNEDFLSVECINSKTDKHLLRLSPNSNFVPNNEESQDDMRFIVKYVNNYPTIKDIKDILLSLQEEYDSSDEVNSFYLNGKRVWLDKATRVGLFNILNLEKSSGKEITTLWFKSKPIKVSVDKALTLLTAVEMYAKQCYDITQQHLYNIANFETLEECLNFDITSNYPDKLNIEIE